MQPKDLFQLQHISRDRKLALFSRAIPLRNNDVVLDVGAARTSFFSKEFVSERVISLDISEWKLRTSPHQYMGKVVADARYLPFKNHSVDIVFSNAVIEHVGGIPDQQHFANEVRRVARRGYFVTTPNKLFPFEFHFRMPLFQFVPKRLQRWLNKHMTIGWVKKGQWQNINLLTPRQFHRLFPSGKLVQQRITIFPETLICYELFSPMDE